MTGSTYFKNKIILVTGAASGIGAATAKQLAQAGATIGLLDIKQDDLTTVANDIQTQGGRCDVLVADMQDETSLQTAINTLTNNHGALHGVFANAGINGVWAPIETLSVQDFTTTITTNLIGNFACIKHATPHLKKQGGAIVITSSVNGTRIFSNTGATAYSASKAALNAMTKMLALELSRDKVRVNVICPGAVETSIAENTEQKGENPKLPVVFPEGQIPLTNGQAASPDKIADLVTYLLSDKASFITGTEVWIDGAESLLVG